MADFMARKVAKHVMKETAANNFGTEDAYYEHVAATDIQGNATGKTIKRRRPIPPGLTKQEEKVLKKVTRRAHRLDTCINICGIRIGWEAIIGIIPWIGDMAGSLMALMVVHTAGQADLPPALKSRMLFNIAIDFCIGLVPFLGDVADAFYRCNTRNAALLYQHLQQRGSDRLKQGQNVRDSSRQGRGQSQDRRGKQGRESSQKGNRPIQQVDNTELAVLPSSTIEKASTAPVPSNARPEPSPAPLATKPSEGSAKGGWLSRFNTSKTQREPDLEHDSHGRSER